MLVGTRAEVPHGFLSVVLSQQGKLPVTAKSECSGLAQRPGESFSLDCLPGFEPLVQEHGRNVWVGSVSKWVVWLENSR